MRESGSKSVLRVVRSGARVYAPQPHRPGKDFSLLRAGYAEINVKRMDLTICVLGLLALIVDGIRCQGVYGEFLQFTPNAIMTL